MNTIGMKNVAGAFLERTRGVFLLLPLALASLTVEAAESGLYAGVAAGLSSTQVDRQQEERDLNEALALSGITARLTTVDTKDTALKVYGGYRITRHWAVEAAFQNLGEVTEGFDITSGGSGTGDLRFKVQGFQLSGVALAPLGEHFTLFAKAGVNFWDVKSTIKVTGPGGTVSDQVLASGVSPQFGLGALYRLSDRLSLRAEWERALNVGDESKTGQADFSVYTLGLQYAFQ